jgi:hypothetical protein
LEKIKKQYLARVRPLCLGCPSGASLEREREEGQW